VHAADSERAGDVRDALHERPDSGQHEEDVRPLDEELPRGPEREPSMSASPANVASGSTKQSRPETRNRTPNSAETHRGPVGTRARAMFSMPASTNMKPTMMPTVVTEAESNWRITSAIASQAMPPASQVHQ
jgi:hypothetical protein